MYESETTQQDVTDILFRLSQEFRSILELDELLNCVLITLEEVKGYHHSALLIEDRETGELVVRAGLGALSSLVGCRLSKEEGLLAQALAVETPCIIRDCSSLPEEERDPLCSSGSQVLAALAREPRRAIVLELQSPQPGALGEEDCRLIGITAPHLAALIEVALEHDEAKTAALHDALTGVHNHRYFYERLSEELARCRRYGYPLSVAIIDVDELKQVNDSYGHQAGDEALRQMAHILRRQVRASDVVARYGGDEFGLIMLHTDAAEARGLLRRLMAILAQAEVRLESRSFAMPKSSYGIATYPDDGTQPQQLFAAADAQLYEEKRRRLSRRAANQGWVPPSWGPERLQ